MTARPRAWYIDPVSGTVRSTTLGGKCLLVPFECTVRGQGPATLILEYGLERIDEITWVFAPTTSDASEVASAVWRHFGGRAAYTDRVTAGDPEVTS